MWIVCEMVVLVWDDYKIVMSLLDWWLLVGDFVFFELLGEVLDWKVYGFWCEFLLEDVFIEWVECYYCFGDIVYLFEFDIKSGEGGLCDY